jgi:hypothetical protein
MWTFDYRHFDDYDKIIEFWFNLTYSTAQRIYDKFKIPFYVVGGMSPVHPLIKQLTFANGTYSWGEDLVGLPHPYNSLYHTCKFFDDYKEVLDDKRMYDEMKACKAFEEILENGSRFQAVHPTRIEHKLLTDKIINTLCV